MAKRYSQMTSDEKNAYWEAYRATRDTLRFAIVDLDVAASNAKKSSDAAAIHAEKLRLEGLLVTLLNESTAVAASKLAIRPPTQIDIEEIKRLANTVDRLTVTDKTYARVVDLSRQALDSYAKVRAA